MKKQKEKFLEKYKTIFVEEFEGPNIEETIKIAINSLKMAKDELTIKVLFEGEPGLFGLEGSKPAKIKVMPKIDKIENIIKYFLIKLLDFVKEKISFIDIKIEDKKINIKILFDDKNIVKKIFSSGVNESIFLLSESFVKKINPEFEINIEFKGLD